MYTTDLPGEFTASNEPGALAIQPRVNGAADSIDPSGHLRRDIVFDARKNSVDRFDTVSARQNLCRAEVAEQRQRCCQPMRGLLFVSENRHRVRHDGHNPIDAGDSTPGTSSLSCDSLARSASATRASR